MTRPAAIDHRKKFSTPDWSSRGFCNTCPRDSMLVIGDESEQPRTLAWMTGLLILINVGVFGLHVALSH